MPDTGPLPEAAVPGTTADPSARWDGDLRDLRAALPEGVLATDTDVLAAHARDQALFCPAGAPGGLVRARHLDHVVATLRFAHAHRIPVVTQGARTGLSGAANAVDGCLLLDVSRMDSIGEVNPVDRTVVVGPGVINQDLKDHLGPYGLSYPPDPGSVAISTIGGNVATDAGGLCCVKYGVTHDYVRNLTVVLADGRVTTLGRPTVKGVAGLDLASLFVGSEGTLGVIVSITLELVPARPAPITAMALFGERAEAMSTVGDFLSSGVQPCMFEFIDGVTLELLEDYGRFGLPRGVGGMLLVQADGDGDLVRARRELEDFCALAEGHGAIEAHFSDDPEDSEALVAARRAINPAMEKYASAHGGGELIDDVCVPIGRQGALMAAVDAAAAAHPEVLVTCAGHVGDGNMHPSVLFDTADPHSAAEAHAAFEEIMRAGLDLGGTISGEHGIGYLKRTWLAAELDEVTADLHRRVKEALDPRGILNPGKMLAAFEG